MSGYELNQPYNSERSFGPTVRINDLPWAICGQILTDVQLLYTGLTCMHIQKQNLPEMPSVLLSVRLLPLVTTAVGRCPQLLLHTYEKRFKAKTLFKKCKQIYCQEAHQNIHKSTAPITTN